MSQRRTIIAPNAWAALCLRFEAATSRTVAARIVPIERMAARLAGGFLQPIDRISTLDAVRDALEAACPIELEGAKDLPGLIRAASSSLLKAWAAGIDLSKRRDANDRLRAMSDLEDEVLKRLPASTCRPSELVQRALARLEHAPAVLGEIRIYGRTEMSPVWRRLIEALADVVPVMWVAGARPVPGWLPPNVGREVSETAAASRRYISCADGAHEALEAVRWAKDLISTGRARPEEIAICAAAPQAFDADIATLADDAGLPIHFIHGHRAIEGRDGQEAAALADVLLSGISLQRLRRLASLAQGSLFGTLPEDWRRILPRDGSLTTLERWQGMLNGVTEWPGGTSYRDRLMEILALLNGGPAVARDVGTQVLGAGARAIWDRALLEGPAEALLTSLGSLAVKDDMEGLVSVVWGPAAAIASYPRAYVRMIGLASGSWPRGISEDPLLPSHVIDQAELNPLPVADADRRDFATILACVTGEIVATRSRRDETGRLLGPSPLWPLEQEMELTKTRAPERAASKGDRLAARPSEFLVTPRGAAARGTWRDWHVPQITAHDGRIRPEHPVVLEALQRPMSASTIRALLTNPIGWLFSEVMSLDAPDPEDEPFEIDPLSFGNLVHGIIEQAVNLLEAGGGLAVASVEATRTACAAAAQEVARLFELENPVPPARLWRLTIVRARSMAEEALLPSFMAPLVDQRSWAEVPFGKEGLDRGQLPWDPTAMVRIGSATIAGKVDRLDVSGDGRRARVIDWKTGKVPKDGVPEMIGGGAEVQRPIYAAAVRQLMGTTELEAGLAYLRGGAVWMPVGNDQACLDLLVTRLEAMRAAAARGLLLPGPDARNDYNELTFALPGDAKVRYLEQKKPAIREALGDAALVWEDA